MTNEKKIIVPNYINDNEKEKYLKDYLNEGYVIIAVYDYDSDYDVYVLKK